LCGSRLVGAELKRGWNLPGFSVGEPPARNAAELGGWLAELKFGGTFLLRLSASG